jgi:N-acetylglutamate synthase-like GNAT family acetyltransferase
VHLYVRRATASDAHVLTALALRSKSHWGYSAALMRVFEPELVITEDYLSRAPVFVAETNGQLVGFAGLSIEAETPELVHLFVEPEYIGKGYGAILWQIAVEEARALKWDSFQIIADPNAESFYVTQGAQRVGEKESSALPGRRLPVLKYCV